MPGSASIPPTFDESYPTPRLSHPQALAPRVRPVLTAVLVIAATATPLLAQMDWRIATASNSPRERVGTAMVFDAARQRPMLSGGCIWGYNTLDTWEWNGQIWTERTSTTAPPRRYGHAMASDTARHRVVLFGGSVPSLHWSCYNDTWEWDGRNWTQWQSVTSPSARSHSAMAYDAVRQRTVLFGGWHQTAGNFGDTWEWDGTSWTQLKPAAIPPARYLHRMVYDAARQRVVLFGGRDSSRVFNDTWEWDGQNWTQLRPTSSPQVRYGHAMTYDLARKRIVLFGGCKLFGGDHHDTWEFDGRNWALRNPPTSPQKLRPEAMAYDPVRKRVVLLTNPGLAQVHQTWEWDGTTWRNATPPTGHPPPSYVPATAYDSARQRIVFFGGQQGLIPGSDTSPWEWDGKIWTRQLTTTNPSPRFDLAMAYDAARRRIVLFGGHAVGSPNQALGDTWEYDGHNWTRQNPATSPPARLGHTMAYDSRRKRVVMFGGATGLGLPTFLNDIWEWDGKSWTARQAATRPPPRWQHAMAYDAARQRLVIYGGIGPPGSTVYPNDTWEWDGAGWKNVTPSTGSPSPRGTHTMAYDAARQRVVLFGGEHVVIGRHFMTVTHYHDTWSWDGSTWAQETPISTPPLRPNHEATMVYHAALGATILTVSPYRETWAYAPRDLTASGHVVSVAAGGTVKLSIHAGTVHAGKSYWVLGCIDLGGPRGIPSLKVKLRLNPDPYFWLTTQVPNPLIANALGTLDASGRATATIQVPPLPSALIGWRVYHAYVVFGSTVDYASTPVPLELAK